MEKEGKVTEEVQIFPHCFGPRDKKEQYKKVFISLFSDV